MLRHVRTLILVVIGCALRVDAQDARSIQVPRGGAVTVDGRVDDAEWRDAMRIESPAGTVIRFLRDAEHLYLGITSERQGFASLCLARNDEVHVLHASAALGAVTYRPRGEVWQSADTAFRYEMRSTALDDMARSQRAAYLSEHGWVASTVSMGDNGRMQEMQIALHRFAPPFSLALARWLFTDTIEWWPSTIADNEGCATRRLVMGAVPQGITFRPGGWIVVEHR